jgi:hypothetical protein
MATIGVNFITLLLADYFLFLQVFTCSKEHVAARVMCRKGRRLQSLNSGASSNPLAYQFTGAPDSVICITWANRLPRWLASMNSSSKGCGNARALALCSGYLILGRQHAGQARLPKGDREKVGGGRFEAQFLGQWVQVTRFGTFARCM